MLPGRVGELLSVQVEGQLAPFRNRNALRDIFAQTDDFPGSCNSFFEPLRRIHDGDRFTVFDGVNDVCTISFCFFGGFIHCVAFAVVPHNDGITDEISAQIIVAEGRIAAVEGAAHDNDGAVVGCIIVYIHDQRDTDAMCIFVLAEVGERATRNIDLAAVRREHAGLVRGIDGDRAARNVQHGPRAHRADGNGKVVRILRIDLACTLFGVCCAAVGDVERRIVPEVQRRGVEIRVRLVIVICNLADRKRFAVQIERNRPRFGVFIVDIADINALACKLGVRKQDDRIAVLRSFERRPERDKVERFAAARDRRDDRCNGVFAVDFVQHHAVGEVGFLHGRAERAAADKLGNVFRIGISYKGAARNGQLDARNIRILQICLIEGVRAYKPAALLYGDGEGQIRRMLRHGDRRPVDGGAAAVRPGREAARACNCATAHLQNARANLHARNLAGDGSVFNDEFAVLRVINGVRNFALDRAAVDGDACTVLSAVALNRHRPRRNQLCRGDEHTFRRDTSVRVKIISVVIRAHEYDYFARTDSDVFAQRKGRRFAVLRYDLESSAIRRHSAVPGSVVYN